MRLLIIWQSLTITVKRLIKIKQINYNSKKNLSKTLKTHACKCDTSCYSRATIVSKGLNTFTHKLHLFFINKYYDIQLTQLTERN